MARKKKKMVKQGKNKYRQEKRPILSDFAS